MRAGGARPPPVEKYFAAQLKCSARRRRLRRTWPRTRRWAVGCGIRRLGRAGPVANLIEAVLGFDLDVPGHTITWTLNRTERHGLKGVRFGEFSVDLLAEQRAGPGDSLRDSHRERRHVHAQVFPEWPGHGDPSAERQQPARVRP